MLRNKRGVTLVELLVVLALMAIMAPLLTNLFMMISRDYDTSTKFVKQMDRINEASQRLSKDIGEAHKVYQPDIDVNLIVLKTMKIDSTNKNIASATDVEYFKCWRLKGNELQYCKKLGDITVISTLSDSDFVTVVSGLSDSSKFQLSSPSGTSPSGNATDFYALLQPIADNKSIHTNRNMNIPVVLSFKVNEKLYSGADLSK